MSRVPKCEQTPYKSERIPAFCDRASSSSRGLPSAPPLPSPTPLNLSCQSGDGWRWLRFQAPPSLYPANGASHHARLGVPDPRKE